MRHIDQNVAQLDTDALWCSCIACRRKAGGKPANGIHRISPSFYRFRIRLHLGRLICAELMYGRWAKPACARLGIQYYEMFLLWHRRQGKTTDRHSLLPFIRRMRTIWLNPVESRRVAHWAAKLWNWNNVFCPRCVHNCISIACWHALAVWPNSIGQMHLIGRDVEMAR